MYHRRMPVSRANVFNIPASAPFLPVLIDALRAGKLIPGFPASGDPLALAAATLYLPTRRACRLAREVFLDRLDGDAAILPRIVALGDLDEDEIIFAEAATGDLAGEALALPPALGGLERRLILAELIRKWVATIKPKIGSPLIANTPSAAMALADDLARLMDDMITRQIGWESLDNLVPGELDDYWQLSLEFLKFVLPRWQGILAEQNAIEAAERRDKLIEAEARRLAGSDAPVIAAGSTGSMPATAKLLATIARLPHGAVVLPGLDMDLDDAAWRLITGDDDDPTHDGLPSAGHAQFAMRGLLGRIGIAREEATQLASPEQHGREPLISEALRPASTTDHWRQQRESHEFTRITDAALASVSLIEATNPEEESLAIAVALREAVDRKDQRAALITPDRALARRVVSALARWKVPVDDSGGGALADSAAGVFARLSAEVALGGLEPVPLLALLKHPLLRLRGPYGAHDQAIAALEQALLRGPRPRSGSAGLGAALATFRETRDSLHGSDPRRGLSERDLEAAADLVSRLAAALAPLEALTAGDHALAQLAARHREVIAGLGKDEREVVAAFSNHDGTVLADALAKLIESPTAAGFAISRGDYAELFQAAIGDRVVRRPETRDVRVHIYGPLEARLQRMDRVVLGGLQRRYLAGRDAQRSMAQPANAPRPRPRSARAPHRPLRARFRAGFGAPEVILTRAAKVGGRADRDLALRAAHRRTRRRTAGTTCRSARQRTISISPARSTNPAQ